MDASDALLTLIACGGPLAPRRELLDRFGTPAAALAAGAASWRACGLSATQVGALHAPDAATVARARDWLAAPGRHLVGWHEHDYPSLLRRGANPPLALFVAGDPARLWHPLVAVVGSRASTAGGRDTAAAFARALAADGFAVGSGLAAGIDTAAHAATLDTSGLTVAVLGTGPDLAYPASNRALHARIGRDGAIVSEFLPGTRAHQAHFPARNRILAALALGTVVIEAAERSGALITARLAAEAGRDVFAVPGSIHNPAARGCHRLIRDGAQLVESAGEVTAALAPVAAALADDLRGRLLAPLPACEGDATRVQPVPIERDGDYKKLWDALGFDPTSMDDLAARSGLTADTLSSMLVFMELEGRVASQHGRFCRLR